MCLKQLMFINYSHVPVGGGGGGGGRGGGGPGGGGGAREGLVRGLLL